MLTKLLILQEKLDLGILKYSYKFFEAQNDSGIYTSFLEPSNFVRIETGVEYQTRYEKLWYTILPYNKNDIVTKPFCGLWEFVSYNSNFPEDIVHTIIETYAYLLFFKRSDGIVINRI